MPSSCSRVWIAGSTIGSDFGSALKIGSGGGALTGEASMDGTSIGGASTGGALTGRGLTGGALTGDALTGGALTGRALTGGADTRGSVRGESAAAGIASVGLLDSGRSTSSVANRTAKTAVSAETTSTGMSIFRVEPGWVRLLESGGRFLDMHNG
jgi:hypothetical protein